MKKDWQEQLPLNHIRDIKTVSGGDVNEAFKVTTEDDVYFLLFNAIVINHSMLLKLLDLTL